MRVRSRFAALMAAWMFATNALAGASYMVVVPSPAKLLATPIEVSLADAALPSAQAEGPYAGYDFNNVLTVTGDSAYNPSNVAWSLVSGALPSGMSLSAGGTLLGTPTAEVTGQSFTIQAMYKTKSAQHAYSLNVLPPLVVGLGGATLPQGQVSVAYAGYDFNSVLSVTGDKDFTPSAVSWSIISGSLPSGLALSSDGKLSGTPTAEVASQSVTIQAAYKTKTAQKSYTLSVQPAPVVISLGTATLPQGQVGSSYSGFNFNSVATITGGGAFDPAGVTWSLAGGSLPAGLSLGANGVLSGTPTAEATAQSITVKVAYKTKTAQQTYAVTVQPPPVEISLNSTTLAQGQVSVAYAGFDFNSVASITGGGAFDPAGVNWSIVSGALPAGMSLSSASGLLTGTPTAEVTNQSFTLKVSYKGKTAQQTYSMSVAPAPVVLSLGMATPPQGQAGSAYAGYDFNSVLSVTGGGTFDPAGVSWSIVSGSIPAGMSLGSATGVLSGTPTAAGGGSFTLRVSYKGKTAQQGYSVTIQPKPATYAGTVSMNSYMPILANPALTVTVRYVVQVNGAAKTFVVTAYNNTTANGGGAMAGSWGVSVTGAGSGSASKANAAGSSQLTVSGGYSAGRMTLTSGSSTMSFDLNAAGAVSNVSGGSPQFQYVDPTTRRVITLPAVSLSAGNVSLSNPVQ